MDIDGTLRWVLWLIFVAFALFLYFYGPGQSGVGSSHLSLAIEVTLFALGTAAATLRAAKLYPEHDVRGGARPPRPTSLPFSWWHGFTGITGRNRPIARSLTRSPNLYGHQAGKPSDPLDLADTQEACEPYAAYAQHTLVSTRRHNI
jgi:hypothetical protein